MREEFRDIKGYEGLYQVSNLGRVKSLERTIERFNYLTKRKNLITQKEKILKPKKERYLRIELSKNGKAKIYLLHRLVAEAFIPNPENLPQINHKDENKYNNCVDNLEWCSAKYNRCYSGEKSVNQYDKEGNYIKTWKSIKEAQDFFKIGHISECCRGKVKTAGGFIWQYKD